MSGLKLWGFCENQKFASGCSCLVFDFHYGVVLWRHTWGWDCGRIFILRSGVFMTLPPNLLAEAEAAFEHNGIHKHRMLAACEWLFQRLCELSDREFDSQAIAEQAGFHSVDIQELHGTECPALLEYAMRIARHQHSLDMAALLRQREEIASLKHCYDDLHAYMEKRGVELFKERAKCERLEKALREIAENVDDISSYEIARLALSGEAE